MLAAYTVTYRSQMDSWTYQVTTMATDKLAAAESVLGYLEAACDARLPFTILAVELTDKPADI